MSASLEKTTTPAGLFAEMAARLDREQPAIAAIRQKGLDYFFRLGFPTSKDEAWRFTSVAAIARTPFGLAEPLPVDADAFRGLAAEAPTMVFVNGVFSPALSTCCAITGVTTVPLARAVEERNPVLRDHLARYADASTRPFVALNTALLRDGALLLVAPGTIVDRPIQILHLAAENGGPAISSPRNLILLGQDSQVRIVETYIGWGGAPSLTNAVTEIVAGPNAVLDHYKLQLETEAAYHVGSIHIEAQRSSQVTSHSLSLGAALARTDIDVALDGEGAGCVLNGLYVARGSQHVDHHTVIDHAQPHCDSQEFYKGILDGRARGVFDGVIIVRKGAQKTNSGQVNRNLLLSEEAIVDSKPQLEIYADDVKCTHGSTIGQLDEDSMFYLRSRGIGLEDARNILTWAFASEVVERVRVPFVRSLVEASLLERLPRSRMESSS